jgi:hypothetical protein
MRISKQFWRGLMCSCMVAAGVVCPAVAVDSGAYLVSKSSSINTSDDVRLHRIDHSRVVTRPITASAAVIDRDLSEQPVHRHLIEMQMVNTTIYLDPQAIYSSLGNGGLDKDHSIVRAQRLYNGLHTATPARLVRHPLVEEAAPTDRIMPRAIIQVPIRRPLGNPPQLEPKMINARKIVQSS